MRASASDTALDRLDATSMSAQRYLSPNEPHDAVSAAAGSSKRYGANFPATPPRRKTATHRAASQPPVTVPDKTIRAAAARPAMSARLPQVPALLPGLHPAQSLYVLSAMVCLLLVYMPDACKIERAMLMQEKVQVPTKALPSQKQQYPQLQNGHHASASVTSHPIPPAPESDGESLGFVSPRCVPAPCPSSLMYNLCISQTICAVGAEVELVRGRGVMSANSSPEGGSDDGAGSSAGYITPPEALSSPRRSSPIKRNSADDYLVQRSPASLPIFSSPGHRTPAEMLVLETEALKQSLQDLQPSSSGRNSTPSKGKF